MSADKMKVLTDFLENRKGYAPFTFTVPFEATPRQWICDTWQVDYPYGLHQTLTAQFTENFDP
jgi:phage-related protein